jgi:hypothetical protein
MHCLDAGREILLGQRRFHDAQMQVLEKRQAEDEIAEVIPVMSERYGDLRVSYPGGFVKTSRAAIRSDAAQIPKIL